MSLLILSATGTHLSDHTQASSIVKSCFSSFFASYLLMCRDLEYHHRCLVTSQIFIESKQSVCSPPFLLSFLPAFLPLFIGSSSHHLQCGCVVQSSGCYPQRIKTDLASISLSQSHAREWSCCYASATLGVFTRVWRVSDASLHRRGVHKSKNILRLLFIILLVQLLHHTSRTPDAMRICW